MLSNPTGPTLLGFDVIFIGTLLAFKLVWRWNDYLWPFLIVAKQEQWTVQLAIANSIGRFSINWRP